MVHLGSALCEDPGPSIVAPSNAGMDPQIRHRMAREEDLGGQRVPTPCTRVPPGLTGWKYDISGGFGSHASVFLLAPGRKPLDGVFDRMRSQEEAYGTLQALTVSSR